MDADIAAGVSFFQKCLCTSSTVRLSEGDSEASKFGLVVPMII